MSLALACLAIAGFQTSPPIISGGSVAGSQFAANFSTPRFIASGKLESASWSPDGASVALSAFVPVSLDPASAGKDHPESKRAIFIHNLARNSTARIGSAWEDGEETSAKIFWVDRETLAITTISRRTENAARPFLMYLFAASTGQLKHAVEMEQRLPLTLTLPSGAGAIAIEIVSEAPKTVMAFRKIDRNGVSDRFFQTDQMVEGWGVSSDGKGVMVKMGNSIKRIFPSGGGLEMTDGREEDVWIPQNLAITDEKAQLDRGVFSLWLRPKARLPFQPDAFCLGSGRDFSGPYIGQSGAVYEVDNVILSRSMNYYEGRAAEPIFDDNERERLRAISSEVMDKYRHWQNGFSEIQRPGDFPHARLLAGDAANFLSWVGGKKELFTISGARLIASVDENGRISFQRKK